MLEYSLDDMPEARAEQKLNDFFRGLEAAENPSKRSP
jgi:hypothetical protein